jgi:G3E family GTPase
MILLAILIYFILLIILELIFLFINKYKTNSSKKKLYDILDENFFEIKNSEKENSEKENSEKENSEKENSEKENSEKENFKNSDKLEKNNLKDIESENDIDIENYRGLFLIKNYYGYMIYNDEYHVLNENVLYRFNKNVNIQIINIENKKIKYFIEK